MTPTEKILYKLTNNGFKILVEGGQGFILPRYWLIQTPKGKKVWATKTYHLKEIYDKGTK